MINMVFTEINLFTIAVLQNEWFWPYQNAIRVSIIAATPAESAKFWRVHFQPVIVTVILWIACPRFPFKVAQEEI